MIRSFTITTDATAFENVADAASEHLVSEGILAVSEFDVIDAEQTGEAAWSVTVDIDMTEPVLAFCRDCGQRIVNLSAGVLVRNGLPLYHATCFAAPIYRSATNARIAFDRMIRAAFPRFTTIAYTGDTEAEVTYRSDVPGVHVAHVRMVGDLLETVWSNEDTNRLAWEAGE